MEMPINLILFLSDWVVLHELVPYAASHRNLHPGITIIGPNVTDKYPTQKHLLYVHSHIVTYSAANCLSSGTSVLCTAVPLQDRSYYSSYRHQYITVYGVNIFVSDNW